MKENGRRGSIRKEEDGWRERERELGRTGDEGSSDGFQ